MTKLVKRKGEYILKDYSLSLTNDMFLDTDSNNYLEVEIKLIDRRKITDQQRKFIFALCNEISYHLGEDVEWCRMLVQTYNAKLRDIEVVSLSHCDMTYANGLIDTILNFMIEQEIPFSKRLIDDYGYRFDEKQTYSMCLKRVCVVCGGRADLHHVDAVGMGRNRQKIDHKGHRMLPLCRSHHNEAHTMGDGLFIEKYHLTPIVVDEKMNYFIKKGKLKVNE